MAQKPFVLPSGVDFYAGDGSAAGNADPLFRVDDANNRVGINTQTPTGTLDITVASTGDRGLIIRTNSSQATNVFEVLGSNSSGIFTIDQSGGLYFAPWSGTAINPIKYDAFNNRMVFTGSGTGASGINLNVLQDSTLSFEATAGQLFSIGDGLASGTIFSVNDISGMSSIEVDASGLIKIGEFDGFLGIGTSQLYGQYSGKMEVNAPSGYKTLILRPGSGSTSNTLEIQSASSGTLATIDYLGQISGVSLSSSSGLLLLSGVPSSTSNKLYASGSTLYFNGSPIGGGTTTNALTFASGLTFTSSTFNGSSAVTIGLPSNNLYGTGTIGWVPYFNSTSGVVISSGQSVYIGTITSTSSASKALVVSGVASQSANLIEWGNNGITYGAFDSAGKLGVGTGSPSASIDVTAASSSTKALVVRANNTQSVNILEVNTGGGSPLFIIDSGGAVSGITATVSSGITLPTGIPAVTTNKLYNSGSYLQFNGANVSGVTINPLTFNSGIAGTISSFNGSISGNIALGGSGNLTNLVVSSGVTLTAGIPAVTTNNNLYASGSTLFWNGFAVSGGPIGPAGPGGASGNYGSFYDITTQTYPSTTGVTVIGIGQVAEARNISISGGNAMVFNAPGTYSITYSIQFLNGVSQSQDVDVWLRKNGADVSGSNTIFTIPPQHAGGSGAIGGICNYIYTFNSGDYIQLASASNSTSVVIAYVGTQSSPTVPSTPSVILTAQQVMYTANAATLTFGSGLSGSTSGSYNGSGNVTMNLGGTGTLNQLIFSTGTIIGDINTASGRISPTTSDIFIGNSAGQLASGASPIFIGPNAGVSATGTTNIFIGNQAGNSFPGNYNVIVGTSAAQNNNGTAVSGDFNAVIGYRAFRNSSGSYNVAVGYSAGGEDSNGTYSYNTNIGYQAGYQGSGTYNVSIGYNAGLRVYGTGNIEIRANNTNPPLYGTSVFNRKLNIGETIVGDMASKKIFVGDGSVSGNFAPTATLQVKSNAATDKTLVVQAAVSQTANLLEFQNASGTALTVFDPSGRMSQTIAGNSTNLAIGANALNTFNGTWNSVTVIGNGAGSNMGSAGLNTAIGANAMAGTVGNNNTAIGVNAMASATSSFTNSVAIGDSSMQYASGSNNTAIGSNSLRYAGGQYNVGIGLSAGAGITTGGGNVIIGANAGTSITTSSYSTLIGQNAGASATAATTAVGYSALQSATAGGNTAFGNSAGSAVTVGSNNTIMGDTAYLYAPSGSNNVVVGQGTLPNAYNTISNSVVIGQNAMNAATNSSNHVIIGRQAGYSITTGGSNTLLGYGAGYTITTGAGNTLLGTSADVGTNSITGSIAIGSGAQANQNNQLVIGSASTKVGKSDGTGEQSPTSASPSGISKLIEARINGTSYNIPLLPITATHLSTQYSSGIVFSTGVILGDSTTASGRSNIQPNNIYIGNFAGTSGTNVSNSTSHRQINIGYGAGYNINYGVIGTKTTICMGNLAASGSTLGGNDASIFIGDNVFANGYEQGDYNIFIGSSAGQNATGTANASIYIGRQPMFNAWDEGTSNAIGYQAGYTSSGSNNIYFGTFAGYFSSGKLNTFIGIRAGARNNGSGNIEIQNPILGNNSSTSILSGNYSNKLNIGQVIVGDISTARLAIGSVSASNLSPNSTLQIIPQNATDKVLIVQGANSQSANLQEWQNSAGTILSYIDTTGLYSGISASFSSGITLSSGIPAVTTNKLYASGSTLYFNGSAVGGGGGGGTTTNALTFGSGLSGSTATTFNGSAAVTVNLGGTGTLTALTVSSGINLSSGIPSSTTGALYASGTSLYWNSQPVTTGISGSGTPSGVAFWSTASNLSYDTGILYSTVNKRLVFTGTGTGANPMNMNILSNSTLSFESTAGQLFSISDGLQSGRIFAVTDISGMPFIEVDASGLVKLGEFDGFIGLGTSQTYGQYSGKMEITSPSGYKGLIIRPASGSSSNIFEAQNFSSGTLTVIDASGRMHIGGTGSLNQLEVDPLSAATKGLVIKSAASQTANLFEVQNSSGSGLLAITSSGAISGAITPTIITSTGGLTLTDVHNGYIIEQTGVAGSGTFTLGTVNIPGWNCMVVNIGSGVIIASGSNTMRSPGGLNKSRTQYSSISIYRRGANDFVLGGDLA